MGFAKMLFDSPRRSLARRRVFYLASISKDRSSPCTIKGGCNEWYNDYLFTTVRDKALKHKVRNFDGL